ncbi:hypothetical protein [Plantactinospora soyae]|uniref:Uncharacterized protein n=1 Tax=Plantactinospora soyae TaxID=1544732 RepID=A0A927M6P4_9ACTN|nr:hypothetical protein [Plantactinospora soyae]MBE1488749.1 hypothetical protein [Plantactinospora soyae]
MEVPVVRTTSAERSSRLHVTWHRWRRHVDLCRTSTMLCPGRD